jgi:IS30 family transposase
MEGMGLPKDYRAVILGKHLSSVYRGLNRNGTGGVYTGNEAQQAKPRRRKGQKTAAATRRCGTP